MNSEDRGRGARAGAIDRRTVTIGIGLAALIEGAGIIALIVRGLRRARPRGPRRPSPDRHPRGGSS